MEWIAKVMRHRDEHVVASGVRGGRTTRPTPRDRRDPDRERQCGDDASCISNAAGRDDRHTYGIHDLRHQRERADLRCKV